jgi:tetratricopeptide (TPR) repeat protein
MKNGGFKRWIEAIGSLRATLLFVAVISKVLLYISNPPPFSPFISTKPLILSFPFLVALDLIGAVVTAIIAVECVRIGFRSTSAWSSKTHFIVVFGLIVVLAGSRVPAASQTSKTYYSHGWSLAEKGDYQQALLSLEIAVRYDRNHMNAYLERAYVHRMVGDFAAALSDCNKAIDLAPKNADAYACRGYAYYGLCDGDRAINEWRKAISLDANLSGRLDKWMKAVKDPLYKC